jgi:hypothetical protein
MKFSTLKNFSFFNSAFFGKLLLFFFTVLILLFLWAAFWTGRSLQNFSAGQFAKAGRQARYALWAIKGESWLTFQQSDSLFLWQESLHILAELPNLQTELLDFTRQNLNPEDAEDATQAGESQQKILLSLEKMRISLQKIQAHWPQAKLAQELLKKKRIQPEKISFALDRGIEGLELAENFLSREQHYLVIFQNSDELRATGGFMGSYATLHYVDGRLQPFAIRDIYDAAGQVSEMPLAEPGAAEYLSADGRLALQDSNWNPDFPQSAALILDQFSQVEAKSARPLQYQGVVAVNLSLLERVLDLLGPIDLQNTDENHNLLTAENFAQLARADRAEFFPGSQEKASFLNQSFQAIKLQAARAIAQQPFAWLKLLLTALTQHELQLYAQDQELQKFFEQQGWAGQMLSSDNEHFYFFIESNVGINKVNRGISRQLFLQSDGRETQLRLHLSNQNPNKETPNENPYLLTATHNHYVDYQRLYLPLESKVESITLADHSKVPFQTRIFQTSQGEKLLEVAFLLTVWAEQDLDVTITLRESPALYQSPVFFFQKQSGVPAYQIDFSYQKGQSSVQQSQNLDQNRRFDFSVQPETEAAQQENIE